MGMIPDGMFAVPKRRDLVEALLGELYAMAEDAGLSDELRNTETHRKILAGCEQAEQLAALAGKPRGETALAKLSWLHGYYRALSEANEDTEYLPAASPKQWARRFDLTWKTIKRKIDGKTIRARTLTSKYWQIHAADAAKLGYRP